MIDDASKAVWQRQFTFYPLPHLPLLSTLIETVDKLDGVRGFIEPLSNADEAERDQGLFVGSLAIRYGMKTLEHFGLIYDDDVPMPIHLDQAKIALTNLVAEMNEFVQLGQMAGRPSPSATEDGIGDASHRDAVPIEPVVPTLAVVEPQTDNLNPVIDRETFSVRLGDKCCELGNGKEFQLLERLHRARKTFLPITTLMDDVWTDSEPEKNTVQKTVGNLRKKLKAAGLADHLVIKSDKDHYQLVIR